MPHITEEAPVARFRFKGSERHSVPVLGRYVDPREVVEIPDDDAAQYEWPEDMWAPVDPPSKKAVKAAAAKNAPAEPETSVVAAEQSPEGGDK